MKYIVGNWKMFPQTLKEAKQIVGGVKKAAATTKQTRVIVCAPGVYLSSLVGKGKLLFGAQDCHFNDEGAHTGETSPAAIKSLGASYVILGHSERRAMGENSQLIAQKVSAAVRNGLSVVLCVGELTRDDDGEYFNEVREQLLESLSGFTKGKSKQLIVAYEPVWAIGKNAKRPATPEEAHEMVILIKKTLVHFFGRKVGFTVPILYGASVDVENVDGFFMKSKVDGLLVGRASLDVQKFTQIIKKADSIKK